MISAEDLAYMRGVQALAMTDTCTRLQRVTSPDGMGGQGEAWPPQGAPFPCRLTDAGTDVPNDLLQRLKGNDGYTVTFATEQAVAFRDRLNVTGRGVYEVVAVDAGGTWETARRCLCVKVA